MLRRIISIDKEKCDGCGLCVSACHEGAIGLENGKAVLLRDDYCDGLGDCLPACPQKALSFEVREALPYDEAAVMANIAMNKALASAPGCPGSRAALLTPLRGGLEAAGTAGIAGISGAGTSGSPGPSGSFSLLRQWPVQLKLVPVNAPYLQGADLLLSADCAAYAYGNFHRDFMKDKVTLIACPKLDDVDYTQKLIDILRANAPASLTVVRMSVPCCQGLERMALAALAASGADIPFECRVITPEGELAGA